MWSVTEPPFSVSVATTFSVPRSGDFEPSPWIAASSVSVTVTWPVVPAAIVAPAVMSNFTTVTPFCVPTISWPPAAVVHTRLGKPASSVVSALAFSVTWRSSAPAVNDTWVVATSGVRCTPEPFGASALSFTDSEESLPATGP